MAKKDYPIEGGFLQEDYEEGSILPRVDPEVLGLLYNPPEEKPYQDAEMEAGDDLTAVEVKKADEDPLTLENLKDEEPALDNLVLDLEHLILKEHGTRKPHFLTIVKEYDRFNKSVEQWARMHDDPHTYDHYAQHLLEFANRLEEGMLLLESESEEQELQPYLSRLYKKGVDVNRRLLIADQDNWQHVLRTHIPFLLSLNNFAENETVALRALRAFNKLEEDGLAPEDHEIGGRIYAALTEYDFPLERKLEYYRNGIKRYEDALTTTTQGVMIAESYVDLVNEYVGRINPSSKAAEETLGRARDTLDYAARHAPKYNKQYLQEIKADLGRLDEGGDEL